MKNILIIILISTVFYGCKTTYESTVTGLENTASIKVVKANKSLNSYDDALSLIVDGEEFKIDRLYSEKKSMKAPIFPVTPGKHIVIIKNGNQNVFQKNLFIDNRETRLIILK